jgi:hypothetical protein
VTHEERVLEALVRHARPIMLEYVRFDSCIPMTRVAIEVLEHFGIAAWPSRAMAILMNRHFLLWRAAGGDLSKPLPEEVKAAGAWAVGVGVGPRNEVIGHYVALTERWIIDLALDQGGRPEHSIPARVDAFLRDETLEYELGESARVAYKLEEIDGHDLDDSPDWTDFDKRYRAALARVIRAVKADLKR